MVSRDCDFIPAEYHEQRRARGLVRKRIASVGCLIGIMLIWFGANEYRLKSAEAMMRDVEAQKAQVESTKARKAQMEQARGVLLNIEQLLHELAGGRSLVAMFGELSRRVPDSIVLTGCRVYEPTLADYSVEVDQNGAETSRSRTRSPAMSRREAQSPHVVEPESVRRGLTIYGVARSIPDIIDFAAALDDSPAFYEVEMDVREPALYAGKPAQRFRLTCQIAQQTETAQ